MLSSLLLLPYVIMYYCTTMTIIVIVLLFLFVMIILSLLYVLSYAKLSSNHTTCSFTIWRYSLPAILKMSGAVAATTRRAAPATSTLPAEKVQNLIQVGCKHRKHLEKPRKNRGKPWGTSNCWKLCPWLSQRDDIEQWGF